MSDPASKRDYGLVLIQEDGVWFIVGEPFDYGPFPTKEIAEAELEKMTANTAQP